MICYQEKEKQVKEFNQNLSLFYIARGQQQLQVLKSIKQKVKLRRRIKEGKLKQILQSFVVSEISDQKQVKHKSIQKVIKDVVGEIGVILSQETVKQKLKQVEKQMDQAKQFSDKKKKEIPIMKQKESILLQRSNESIILEQKQKNIIFTKLPARLVNIILEMLDPNEVPVLRCVCRWFKDYIDSNDNLIAIQVFSLFFPKQVDFFCDYGENDIFLQERAKKNYIISHNTRNQSKWRSFLKIYRDVRESFLAVNYKIFLFGQEQKEKQQNKEQTNQNNLLDQKNNFNGNPNKAVSKLGGLAPLPLDNDLDDSTDQKGTGFDFDQFGFNASSSQQEDSSKNKFGDSQFKFNMQDQESGESQNTNQQQPLFKFKQSQDSDNVNSSQNTENQDVCSMDFSKHKIQAQKMSQITSKYIWGVLKDPPLPILKLRRENIGNYCNTWFQNKLAEVLWEGSRQIGIGLHKFTEEEQPLLSINNIIRDNKQYFIDEIKQFCEKWPFQKNEILNLRYYFYKNKPTFSYVSRQTKRKLTGSFNKQTSPRILFTKPSRNLSTMEDQGFTNILGTNKSFQSQINTNLATQNSNPNPVVFNFFDNNNNNNHSNRDSLDQYSSPTKPQIAQQNSQGQKGLFDNIFQFAHKQPDQDNDFFTDLDLDNQEEENNQFQENDYIMQMRQKPLLICFIENLVDLFIFKCQLIYEYLKEHMNGQNVHESSGIKKNGFDLLSEYNIKWNIYIAFLNEIEEQLKDVFEVYNEAFDQIFEDYPQHPRMSIWRLMVKIWIQEIYSKDEIKENLYGCFLKILSIRRQENFQFQMKQIELDRKVQQQYYMPDQLEYISLTLLNNLTKNKNFSLLNYGEGYDYFHSFFSKNQYHADSLLSSFVESTVDLSLNEISVHYLGHSQVQMDKPYLELEKQLLDSSQIYFRHQQSMFLSNPSNYLLFLKGDLKYVSKIFKERSQTLLRKKMLEHWKEMFKDIIAQKLPKQFELFNEKDEKTKNLIQQHVKQQIQSLKIQQQNQIQSDNNLAQPLLAQQNTQSQDGEDQSQQLQASNLSNQQNEEQPNRQSIFSNDTLPSLIYQILEEQELKQKQQEQIQIELNSKTNSVDTHQILLQKSNNNSNSTNNNIFNCSNDLFSIEKKGDFFDQQAQSNNQSNFFECNNNEDDLPEIPGINNNPVIEKKDISTRSNLTQQNLGFSSEELEKIQEKAHILSHMFRMGDDQTKLDIQNYIETCKSLNEMNTSKSDQDLEIEELNNMRRLPIVLNNEEQTFFFLTRSLTEEVLQETILKQKEFLRQQRESNNDGDSEEDEEENEHHENQHYSGDEEEGDEHEQSNGEPQLKFDDDEDDDSNNSLDEIPNSLSLKGNKTQNKPKKNKAKQKVEQDIPVYNSGDESDSHVDDTTTAGNINFFNVKKQESNASDFSLGLDKETSRISNHFLFNENLTSNQKQEQEDKIQFNFDINSTKQEEAQQQQQPMNFDFFKLEKQSSAPGNQINMFTFKLQSNDQINIKANKKSLDDDQEHNFFANCTPSMSQNNQNNSKNSNTQIKVDLFSNISNNNNNNDNQFTINFNNNITHKNNTTSPSINSQNMFFNLLNNINKDNNSEETSSNNNNEEEVKDQS
ncbi:cell division protein (macronuclear) [Tetrahymena thermophila SB210]|uniref:Cell division protein n=1 Tax=Tetrahymena thermophila (strain SB210) TaxID=312017 RepID=Q240L4_TETTS|nr:cell division protein [Tetrahymena thermophila SB210]EAS02194.2 cell division protein [Tetrahymena thermophila SB210]|eukprot:XP_001022439.2 cell division protein [Tetrahymena thermophila SB210]